MLIIVVYYKIPLVEMLKTFPIWKFFRSYVESGEHPRPICRWRVVREADSSEAIESTPLSTIFVPIKPLTSNF